MAVNDDDERFWSLVWPKLAAGTWRFELQSKRARVATISLSTEDSSNVIVSCMGDDDGASTSCGEAGRSVAAGVDKGVGGGYNDDTDGDRKTTHDNPPSRKSCDVPVFFPPPRGVASEALEEAMRRNLPADGSAGAERPDRFEGVDAVIELLTQVPGFPAAMTFGTAPNMDAVAAAAEAVSTRPPHTSKPTTHRSTKSTGRLAPRFPALSTATNEPQPPRSESSTLTNVSTRHGRIIRKPVKLEVNPGRQALIGRNGKADVVSAGTGGAGKPERCVARLGTAANASGLKRASSGCQPWTVGDRSGCANIAGRRTGDGAAGDCSGGGDRAGSRSGGGGSATDGRSKCDGDLRSTGGGVSKDAYEHGGCGSHVGKGTGDGGASGSNSTGMSTGPGGAEESVNGTLGPKSTNVAWVIPCPPPERPVGSLGDDPTETVKEYKRSFEDVIWPALMHEFEWTRVIGPRPTDNYFMPKGVVRGQNGARCREDFFDSHRQVIKHMVENECRFRHILERAWDSAVAKPRPPAKPVTSRQKRKKAPRQRQSAMMEKEYPKKVSQVGSAHQVDPSNLCARVSKEEYVPPEDVEFEQVWAPLPLLPDGQQSQAPEELVREFADVVSQDKCLEVLYRCGGDLGRARAPLNNLLRMWRAKYPDATSASRATTAAREVVARETLAMHQTMASASATASAAGVALGVEVGSFLRRGAQRQLQGGEAALRRQVEGGLPCRPPGIRSRDKLPLDLNLARPWSCGEAETFTRVLLEESVKNFSAVQKALPERQVCELVDRYYGGWKQTDSYRKLKGTISLAKLQSVCWVCQTGGDLMCCEGCDAVYHISCVGLTALPEGDWFCLACTKTKKNASLKETQGTGTDSAPPPQPEVCALGSGTYSTRDRRKRSRPGGSGEGSGAWKNQSVKDVGLAGSGGNHSPPCVVKSDQTGANASCAARRASPTPGVIERVPILLGNSQSRGSQPQEEQKHEEREQKKEGKEKQEQGQHVPESSSPALAASSKIWNRSKVVVAKFSEGPDASTPISCSKSGDEMESSKLAPSSPGKVPGCESRLSPDSGTRSDSTEVSTGVDAVALTAGDHAGEARTARPAEPEKTEQEWWLCMTCSIFNQGRCCRLCSGTKPTDQPGEDDDMGEDEDIEVDVVAVGMGPGEAVAGGMFGRGAVPTASFALALPPA